MRPLIWLCALPLLGIGFAGCRPAEPQGHHSQTPYKPDVTDAAVPLLPRLERFTEAELFRLQEARRQENPAGWVSALWEIAETGSEEEALQALRLLAEQEDPQILQRLCLIARDDAWPMRLRRFVAEALIQRGTQGEAEVGLWTLAVLGTPEDGVRLAQALRGFPPEDPLGEVAAAALAKINWPGATPALMEALEATRKAPAQEENSLRQTAILDALGSRPFAETQSLFTELLDPHRTEPSLRSAAAEALANSSADSRAVLLQTLSQDPAEDVRAMAAWALSAQVRDDLPGAQLRQFTEQESSSEVRTRLYEAMLGQKENPAGQIWGIISQEEDPAARIAGFNALGDAIGQGLGGVNTARFDVEVVPQLLALAQGADSLNLRLRSVFALRRAATPAAQAALQKLAGFDSPEVAQAARNGLLSRPFASAP